MYPKQYRRRRGVVLTCKGLQKIQAARDNLEICRNGKRQGTLENLSAITGLDTNTLSRVFIREKGVDKRTISTCFRAFGLKLEVEDYTYVESDRESENQQHQNLYTECLKSEQKESYQSIDSTNIEEGLVVSNFSSIDLGIAPDVSNFYGRTSELETLRAWFQIEDCRLVSISGSLGIGKTSLAAKLLEQVQEEFEYIIWKSSQQSVGVNELIREVIRFLSRNSGCDILDDDLEPIIQLLHYLKLFRCLVIFDDVEAISEEQKTHQLSNSFNNDSHKEYDRLLQLFARSHHQSCLMITGQKNPRTVKELEGKKSPIRVMRLQGLKVEEGQEIFKMKGDFQGTRDDWYKVITYYGGNPLLLKHVATSIQRFFQGDISEFLKQNILITNDVLNLLDYQFNYLTNKEKEVMRFLSQYEQASFSDLYTQIASILSKKEFLKAINTLDDCCLIEQKDGYFFLHPFLRDYISEYLSSTNLILEENYCI